jgi:hypothetical protein
MRLADRPLADGPGEPAVAAVEDSAPEEFADVDAFARLADDAAPPGLGDAATVAPLPDGAALTIPDGAVRGLDAALAQAVTMRPMITTPMRTGRVGICIGSLRVECFGSVVYPTST